MKHSYYGSHTRLIPNRAAGYSPDKNEFKNATYISMTIPYAAGALMSNVHDLFLWNRAMMHHKLITKVSTDKAFTNYTTNNGRKIGYGYGWGIGKLRGSSIIHHGGNIFGYSTIIIWLPQEDVYVSMLTNRDRFSPDPMGYKIAAYMIGKPYPEPNPNIKITKAYAQRITGKYTFEDQSIRNIIFEDDQLFSQRQGSGKFKIAPYKVNGFVFDGSAATITFRIGNQKTEAVFESSGGTVVKGVSVNN